jgi:hypothetical protein
MARTAELRFDINLLVRHLTAISDWVKGQPGLKNLAIGYFGASTGAAAALAAAADRDLTHYRAGSRSPSLDARQADLSESIHQSRQQVSGPRRETAHHRCFHSAAQHANSCHFSFGRAENQ